MVGRNRGSVRRLAKALLGLLAAAGLLTNAASAAPDGRALYERGVGEGPVEATIARGLGVPGAVVPCAGCHGVRGVAVSEGGLLPSDLTWSVLTRPYPITTRGGRRHGPYDAAAFLRAVREGLDPAGNPLHPGMPRYRLSDADGEALQVYVETGLGRDPVPGVSADRVVLGGFLPNGAEGAPVAAALRERVERINREGGIYGRAIELALREAPADPPARAAALAALLDEGTIFALVAPWIEGAEDRLTPLLEGADLPVVGAWTEAPRLGQPADANVFGLAGGEREQVRVLVGQAAREGGRAALIAGPGAGIDALVEVARSEARAVGLSLARIVWPDDPRVVRVRLSTVKNLVFLGSEADGVALRRLAGSGTTILALGQRASALSRSGAWQGRVVLSYPLPLDEAGAGVFPDPSTARTRASVAALEALLSGIAAAGRDLQRETVRAALGAPGGTGAPGAALVGLTPGAGWAVVSPWAAPGGAVIRTPGGHR